MDNNSSDDSADIVRKSFPDLPLIVNGYNVGYAAAHNKAIKLLKTDAFMPLNPDVYMTPSFVEEMLSALEREKDIGMVGGKLLRPDGTIDTIGLNMRKNRKNYEIASGLTETGSFASQRCIFGPLGAAPLYSLEMLEDIKINDEYFDEDFFAYREEVDLCWRAQLFGWKAIYTPRAIAYHVHAYTDKTRRNQPKFNRYLQFRNRYFMIMKNDTLPNFIRHIIHILTFELLALFFVLFKEPFLFQAYVDVALNLKRMFRKRQMIMKKRKADNKYVLKFYK